MRVGDEIFLHYYVYLNVCNSCIYLGNLHIQLLIFKINSWYIIKNINAAMKI